MSSFIYIIFTVPLLARAARCGNSGERCCELAEGAGLIRFNWIQDSVGAKASPPLVRAAKLENSSERWCETASRTTYQNKALAAM